MVVDPGGGYSLALQKCWFFVFCQEDFKSLRFT